MSAARPKAQRSRVARPEIDRVGHADDVLTRRDRRRADVSDTGGEGARPYYQLRKGCCARNSARPLVQSMARISVGRISRAWATVTAASVMRSTLFDIYIPN
jgi:hypothetical protein